MLGHGEGRRVVRIVHRLRRKGSGAAGVGAEGELVGAADHPVRAVGVDHLVRPVRERVEEVLPEPVRRVLQRETTGASATDDREALLASRIEIRLEERFRVGAGDGQPTDEAALGLLPEHQLGLVEGLLPGACCVLSPPSLQVPDQHPARITRRAAVTWRSGHRGKGVGNEGGRCTQTPTMGVS